MQSNVAQQLTAEQNQLAKHARNIHKFGGSSLASTQCIERVVDIIRQHCQLADMIVVSANGDTTDALFEILQLANERSATLPEKLSALHALQTELIESLLTGEKVNQLLHALDNDLAQMKQWLVQASEHQFDILAFGELWSARLLSAVLAQRVCPSYFIDSRDFLVIDNERNCQVENEISKQGLKQQQQFGKLAVVTGYICRDLAGQTVTLGRNGSDYSATIMAALAGADNVTLWTDVDGIYSADPRVVPLARKLHRLPNGVAKELGRLGNPVLHAKTLKPLNTHKTHLHVASSFDPTISGTEIGHFGQIAKQELSVTFLNDLLLAQSESFIGEQGLQAAKEFGAICQDTKAGFIVIAQAEQKAVSQWLASHDTEVSFTPAAIIATVGHKVTCQGTIRTRFRRAMKHLPCFAIVDAESEHSFIAVLTQAVTGEHVNNVHHDMTKDARHIGLVVAGLGNIGQRFLELLPQQIERVSVLENLHLVGLVSSSKALINTDGIDVDHAMMQFNAQATEYDHQLLMEWLAHHPYDELIVVDLTPSEPFSLLYGEFFKQGIHVVGANKWAASSSPEQYKALTKLSEQHQALWLGNTTVGAGLPINYTIRDLINSGDKVTEISGIFSGTLSWLFETYDGSVPFSTLLLDALKQGITEPDPREDLSGRDVQRKLLILARLAGFDLAMDDIKRQDLVPEHLQKLSRQDFLSQANELDLCFADKLEQAKARHSCIRYIARFSVMPDGSFNAKVGLETLANDDTFASLSPCDNIFQIKTQWYQDNPLIIRGPGAGRDVTAGGIHSDLVAICQQLAVRTTQVKIKGLE